MHINKVKSAVSSLFGVCIAKARTFGLMFLSVVVMLSPVIVQADMVFDFQMKLAKKGNAEAQYKVGEMYETGFGVKQNSEEAMSWVTKAANKGHETAEFKLLYWDIEKNGMTNANKINMGSLKAKAKQSNPQAAYYLGKMYARGVGLPRNTSSAVKWLNKAASVGIPAAESELVIVRERQQRQLATKRRIDEKKRADLKAKQDHERQAQLEQRRRIKAQQQAQRQAEEKARAEESARQHVAIEKAAIEKRSHEATLASEKAANEKARSLKLKKEEQRQAQIAARKKADMVKKRKAAEAKQKASFESDPCSGKSARFLSTCK
jgi:TPR repeat protein